MMYVTYTVVKLARLVDRENESALSRAEMRMPNTHQQT